ncbi:unnamed protein product [Rhizophagus irregularis]|nr:unnamed protein product [Rhizophagus irregularis]
MLSEKKWRFMEELVIILKEFEKITRILNGDILEKFEEIPDSESANTIEINENRSKKNLNISNPIETKRLVLLFLNIFSKLLEKYWLVYSDQKTTTLLTERYMTYNLQKKIFIEEDEKDNENKDIMLDLDKSLMNNIFGEEENEDDGGENEVEKYLKLKLIRNINPLLVFHIVILSTIKAD